jgi:hypothetical protein
MMTRHFIIESSWSARMSEPEVVEVAETRPSPSRSAKAVSPGRIILWVVFAVIFVGLFFEWRAKSGRDATLAKLNAASAPLREQEKGTAKGAAQNAVVSESDVQKLVVGSPQYVRGNATDLGNREDRYTWKFLLKPHGITVRYGVKGHAGERELMDFESF